MISTKYATFFLIGFVLYTMLMVFIGWFTSRGKSKGSDYLTGGGDLPLFLIFGTMGATLIGTGASIGATSNGFSNGWAGAIYGLGSAGGVLLLSWVVKKSKSKSKGFLTMAEEAQYMFDGRKSVRNVMSIMMIIMEIVFLGSHMNGGATYLSYITGIDMLVAKIIMMVGFGVYILVGGYLAVVWTDFIQFIIISTGFIGITIVSIIKAGGWSEIQQTMINTGNAANLSFYGIDKVGVMGFLSLIAASFLPGLSAPTYRMRVYTSKDDKTAEKAISRSGITVLAFSFLPAIIGMATFTIATKNNAIAILEKPDFAFTYVATTVLGPVLGLLFMISGLSATLSSGDSDAIAGVNIIIGDIYPALTGKKISEKTVSKWSRLATVGILLFSFLATLFANNVMDYISNVIGSITPGIAITMFVGAVWKRVTWQGGLAAIFGGTAFGIAFLLIAPFAEMIKSIFAGPAIPAALISLILILVVSLMTKKESISSEEKMAMVIANRGKEVD